jgi:L-serine deaminase
MLSAPHRTGGVAPALLIVAGTIGICPDRRSRSRRFHEAQGWSMTGEELAEERGGYSIPETRYAITFVGSA